MYMYFWSRIFDVDNFQHGFTRTIQKSSSRPGLVSLYGVQGVTMVADSTNMAAPEYAAPHTGEGKRNVETTVLYFSGDPKVQLEPTVIGG